MVLTDKTLFSKIFWRVCIIDEAHRLKNKDSKLYEAITSLKVDHHILLTVAFPSDPCLPMLCLFDWQGTPLQNNIEELATLLSIVDKKRFGDIAAFKRKYGDLTAEQVPSLRSSVWCLLHPHPLSLSHTQHPFCQVPKLQEELQTVFLRRMKEHVEKSIPPKEETVIEVSPFRAGSPPAHCFCSAGRDDKDAETILSRHPGAKPEVFGGKRNECSQSDEYHGEIPIRGCRLTLAPQKI